MYYMYALKRGAPTVHVCRCTKPIIDHMTYSRSNSEARNIKQQGRRNRPGWFGGHWNNILPKRVGLFNQKGLVPAIARTHCVNTNRAGGNDTVSLVISGQLLKTCLPINIVGDVYDAINPIIL